MLKRTVNFFIIFHNYSLLGPKTVIHVMLLPIYCIVLSYNVNHSHLIPAKYI